MATATIFDGLDLRVQTRQARIGVIGMGYVGLPLGLLFSAERFTVTGFDTDRSKVDRLLAGGSYIARIGSAEIVDAQAHGFSATDDYRQIEEMDVVIICVPTPLDEFRGPDLSFITRTAESIAPHLRAGQLIVLESTTYPGTTEEVLVPILEKNGRGLKAARTGGRIPGCVLCRLFPRTRGSRQHHGRPARRSQGDRWSGRACGGLGGRSVRNNLPSYGAGLVTGCGRDDEAVGKHLPLREHCIGQ